MSFYEYNNSANMVNNSRRDFVVQSPIQQLNIWNLETTPIGNLSCSVNGAKVEKKLPPLRHRIKENSRLLPQQAIDIMTKWYDDHYTNPYPNYKDCEELAEAGKITVNQVKQWFVNVRRRTHNEFRRRRTEQKAKKQAKEIKKDCIIDDILSKYQTSSDDSGISNSPKINQVEEPVKPTSVSYTNPKTADIKPSVQLPIQLNSVPKIDHSTYNYNQYNYANSYTAPTFNNSYQYYNNYLYNQVYNSPQVNYTYYSNTSTPTSTPTSTSSSSLSTSNYSFNSSYIDNNDQNNYYQSNNYNYNRYSYN